MVNESRGWYGAMTLPRELLLKPDGTLAQVPVPELEKLRGNSESVSGMLLEGGQTASWKTEDSQGFEWIAEFDCADNAAYQLDITLLASEDGSEAKVITYIPKESKLILDCNRSGRGEVQRSEAILPASSGEPLKLHVFVDRCSIEVFVNDGDVVFTSRIYPAVMSGGLQIKPEGGAVILQSLNIWSLNRI